MTAPSSLENSLIGASILATLARHARTDACAPAVAHLGSGRTVTYAELVDTAHRIVRVLEARGVGKRDRVVFAVRNHWLVFPLLAACAARRAVLIPVDPDSHRDELAFILGDASPALTIAPAGLTVPRVPGCAAAMTLDDFLGELEVTTPGAASFEVDGAVPDDTALMIYTSGTTGGSKCVMLTSANLLANADSLARRFAVSASDRFFCVLPTHHMNALMMTGMVPLHAGACIVLSDVLSFKNAKRYWQNLALYNITIFSVVPSIMALLLKIRSAEPPPALPAVRFGFCGAAPLTADLWASFESAFACTIHQGYGLTETTCWAVSTVPGRTHGHDSVGVPLDCAEVRIDRAPFQEDEALLFAGSESALRRGNPTGEVLLRGPIVAPGYFKNPRLTAESTSEDGYFRTGDLGYVDDAGVLRITGRLKEVIIRNGSNVFAREVDAVLRLHPAVRDAKTIGVADDLVGERVVSVCVLDREAAVSVHDLRRWCQDRLSPATCPDAVHRMGYLPAGATGKVSMNTLRKVLSGELATEIIASLQSWKFKRAQPSDLAALTAIVQTALIEGHDIPFLAYWGCGVREALADCDRLALVRLRDYVNGARRIPQAPPRLRLIFTDTHARNNRIPEDRMMAYFAAVRREAEAMGIECELLSELWQRAGLRASDVQERLASPAFAEQWASEPLAEKLLVQAARHVEGDFAPAEAARFYYAACALEGAAIAKLYPGHVFTTYNPPEADRLSPPLPKVYLYSFREGVSVKPWFAP